MQLPLVSVRFMVYNNEPYIREAVESILMQKTNFKVEIVVGDDFSTDNTLQVIKSYQDTDNINFKILHREIGGKYWEERQRLGRLYNFINIINNCSGKYIALLDGDDYWTDPLKLQKQVDFLEKNINYSYCGHNSSSIEDGVLKPIMTKMVEIDFENLIFKNFLNSATLVFRANSFDLGENFTKLEAGDWAIQLLAMQKGNAYVLPDYMSVYRIHRESIWNSITKREKCFRGVKLQEEMKKYYSDERSIRIINKAINERKKNFGQHKLSFYERVKLRFK